MTEQLPPPTPIEPAAPPVIVTPVSARSSRLIWLGDIMSTLGGILTLIPELATDPLVVTWMNDTMSPGARRTVGIIAIVTGYVIRRLRKSTTAPIAGTPAAENALPLITPSHIAAAAQSARTRRNS